MSIVFTPAKAKLLSGDLDLNGHDIRVSTRGTMGKKRKRSGGRW